MDKPVKPSYLLTAIQAEVKRLGRRAFTSTAIENGQNELGMTLEEMTAFICAQTDTECYKTMSSTANPGGMQDVYRWMCPNGQEAYVKFSLHADSKVVVQFKEK